MWTICNEGINPMDYKKLTQDQIDQIPDSIEVTDEGAQKLAVGVIQLAVFYAGQGRRNEQSVTLPTIMENGVVFGLGGSDTQHIADPTTGNKTLAGIKHTAQAYNQSIDGHADIALNRIVASAREIVVFALNYANAIRSKVAAEAGLPKSEPVQLPDELKLAYGPFQG